MPDSPYDSPELSRGAVLFRMTLFVLFVFIFLVGVKLFGSAINLAGGDFATSLVEGFKNPFAGLAIGILATAIMQSSSATTSLVVTMVGAGQIPLANAVPVVMGANIGTTITCMMVAMSHINDRKTFARVLACTNVHDIFNILTVCILFPLEIITRNIFGAGILEHMATYLTDFVSTGGEGSAASTMLAMNPIDACVTPANDFLLHFFQNLPLFAGAWKALPAIVFALFLILFSLVRITANMKILMADKMEDWLNRVLKKHGYLGIVFGALMTMLVQSSSITTSLLVPMYAAGVLSAYNAFPLLIGANIGTTITGLLASTVSNSPAGVTIALVHTLFNVAGMLMFYPIPFMRKIPIAISMAFAKLILRNRIWAFAFVGLVFFIIPGLGVFLWSEPQEPKPATAVEQVEQDGNSEVHLPQEAGDPGVLDNPGS
ncbi:MAG: Na/Pi symporter [Planctomycetia bacterium]|nr:Na/Pi symporter [Planctomycetia bacterium]